MKKLLILILATFLSLKGFGQISTDERPVSFENPYIELAFKEQKQDLRVMPRLDMKQIQEEDEKDEQQGKPPRFGFSHDVSFDLDNSGTWDTLPNGDRMWRLSLHCPEALSINLLYDKFHLPQGAKLFIYTEDKKHYIGAFTDINNKGLDREPGGFASGLLYGATITLEYYLPKEVEDRGIISIARVVHGYRHIHIPDDFSQSVASSGDCQVNVNCPEGANWQQEKNAVALILVNGNRYCTGSLINTTCNDDRPLLLTADHCLGGWANDYVKHDAITNPHLPHWSFYWQYESPTCSGSSSPILSTVGATVIANNGNTDFALLRLTEDPKNRNGVTIPTIWGGIGLATLELVV